MEKRYYLLKHKEKNEYCLCNYKSWGNYKLFTYSQVKKNDVLFNPNCEYRNLMGKRWQQCFRGENNIKMINDKSRISNKSQINLESEKSIEYIKKANETQSEFRNRILK